MAKHNYQTSGFERFSYGSFFLGQNIIYVLQLQFLSYFYTENVGLTLKSTAVMLLIAKLWDAFNDPLMGAIVDKVKFKKGKYLPWLKFVTYILPVTVVLMFLNLNTIMTNPSYGLKLAFAYVTLIVWDLIYTMSDAPLFSLSTVMTKDSFERDKLLSYGRFAAALAALTSAVFMNVKSFAGWTGAVAIYMVITFLCMLPLQFKAKERVQYERSDDITFRKIFKYLFKNKYLLIYFVGFFAIEAVNTLQIMATYFCNSNLGDENMVTIVMGLSVLPVLLVAPLLPVLIKWLGKKPLNIVSSAIAIALCILQYFVGYADFSLFLVLTAVRVVFMQIPLLIYGMFTTDCIEYGAYVNGERTEGIAFSIQTFVTKLGGALGNTLCLALMDFFGYAQKSNVQTPRALNGIWQIMTLVPSVGYLVMIIIMVFFYKLSEKDVQKMMEASPVKE